MRQLARDGSEHKEQRQFVAFEFYVESLDANEILKLLGYAVGTTVEEVLQNLVSEGAIVESGYQHLLVQVKK